VEWTQQNLTAEQLKDYGPESSPDNNPNFVDYSWTKNEDPSQPVEALETVESTEIGKKHPPKPTKYTEYYRQLRKSFDEFQKPGMNGLMYSSHMNFEKGLNMTHKL